MKPDYKIEANSKDVTENIRGRLISATLTDNEGIKSDTFEMVLDDRDNAIVLPPSGAELKVWLGYWETGLEYMGLFVFDDDAHLSGPPDQLTLRATAAHVGNSDTVKGFTAALKEQKSRSWHGQTLGTIVAAIADEAGYTARVDAALAAEVIGHVDQTDESDLHFLTRLAQDRNAVAKPAGGFLVFVPRGQSKSATGRLIPAIKLDKKDLTSWDLQLAERNKYASVVAHWTDLASGERMDETAGAGKPSKTLKGNFATQAEARQAAEAELVRSASGKGSPSFTMPGWPLMAAEGLVEISGLRSEYNGSWSVKKATHSFSDSGYSTTIDCELPEAS